MTIELDAAVPADLVSTVEAHGKAVAAGDNPAVLADFLPDRIGQLIGSADVPAQLKSAEVRRIADAGDARFDAVIRYTQPDDTWFELRSRWVRFHDGTWRVLAVRNIPETPPWIDATGPAWDGVDAPHWDGLRDGRLLLQRCPHCAIWIWAPRPICPRCHSFETTWEPVDPVGTVYTWTRTWQAFTTEATGHLPYVVVLVELPAAGGCRLLGVLENADGITPTIGAAVRGTIQEPPDDRHWPLVRWRLDGARA
ncbi:Zn-ribbon domain-containing OB-fold protein [Mycolicibacterium elephantis]|uniref:DNA-binding protein n=1 Tax=Mycolicibacterium elephantis DSM 44368 TaxID=1335622 RepID=A0A439DQF0_9MYCO|nr:zinc ribbon domain-containing protein [Mycolicibacterium elephantis]MCV7219494.1 OB-fold domain-containing protein [Mycolicibacterium elephantis]RWA17928.1 hypothetical protein MELE44368_24685 [Mycolicibacterium elephantis DSM 44368]